LQSPIITKYKYLYNIYTYISIYMKYLFGNIFTISMLLERRDND